MPPIKTQKIPTNATCDSEEALHNSPKNMHTPLKNVISLDNTFVIAHASKTSDKLTQRVKDFFNSDIHTDTTQFLHQLYGYPLDFTPPKQDPTLSNIFVNNKIIQTDNFLEKSFLGTLNQNEDFLINTDICSKDTDQLVNRILYKQHKDVFTFKILYDLLSQCQSVNILSIDIHLTGNPSATDLQRFLELVQLGSQTSASPFHLKFIHTPST